MPPIFDIGGIKTKRDYYLLSFLIWNIISGVTIKRVCVDMCVGGIKTKRDYYLLSFLIWNYNFGRYS